MASELDYICGVSWPRSGHHLLVRILAAYFGDRFGYCEYYSPIDCCKSVPCKRAGAVNFSKNHDRDLTVPIVNGGKYLIQYREFCPSLVSNYEIDVRNKDKDSEGRFRKFAQRQVDAYETFMKRWAMADATDSIFVRLAYERLTTAPAETLEPVIKLFAPGEPLDREKLAFTIGSVERITLIDGIERPATEKGVAATRDVFSFRHYDEALFAKLEERTRSAYETMANLPFVDRRPELESRANSPELPSRLESPGNQNLYVDATGMLALSGIALTGIPRVQNFLAKQAIDDPDPTVKAIHYDRKIHSYRFLTDRERSILAGATEEKPGNGKPGQARLHSFRDARQKIRDTPHLGREYERFISAKIAGPQSGTLKYSAIKYTLRVYRYYRRFLDLMRHHRESEGDVINPNDGIVLLSHMVVFGSQFAASLSATSNRAFICHDLIPWLHPELVVDARQAKRFVANLTLLLHSGAQALCTSDTSHRMLEKFVEETRIPDVQMDRFPLPSSLYETAKSLGRTSRLVPGQPFVIYCSTIETRKNHLLLAKIWKRAHDDGVSLPKLVCAGKWGWGVDELRAYLSANPELSQCIEFVGPLTDSELIDLYRGASFGVVPSHIEGWGFGASECLDFGTPVIVSTAPALQEAVRGLMPVIDANDQDSWYVQIRHLAESPQAQESLRARIKDRYQPVTSQESWQAIKAALRPAA